ncbi:TIGR03364 family FAD-dependent oxidoreductase [Rubrivivax albus]|uniref:TIGR03364 family FAD-dependent oxidoreductase n=1 Tax=Rubrivivax albus TaxID=2499835 RepID=A0A437JWK1_9BURK|nr:TIGR03364 family FAD-dependent oxidoreductase [Rubrivivax albus]RVT51763.1 TIGR03364 family FAD-dependent oxidoreductase [Rubrivivax albus]
MGAGIVGLAHALAAARRGLRVAVVERDHRCVGASIRNFGFVTVTGQPAGDTWRRARASRDIWARVAPQAGIAIEHSGLWLLAHRPRAAEVLKAFMRTPMAQGNELVDPSEAAARSPALRTDGATAAMWSPHELRVESRAAIPRLAAWLAEQHGVVFHWGEAVLEAGGGRVRTSARTLEAGRVVLCPGTALTGVAAPAIARHRLDLTRLQMLRVRPPPGFRLGSAVMADLSLVRYGGYAALPEAAPLLAQLQSEAAASLAAGIHLIVVQSADGTLVVGDSHHRFATPEPFADEQVDQLILKHLRESLKLDQVDVVERWTGVYPTGAPVDCVIEAPDADTRVVVVTSGTGASTAFGIAEEVFDGWE